MGVGARVGVGVPARGGCCCCCCALGTGVDPRGGGGVRGEGVEAFVVFTDAEGGGRGERVRRVIGTVKVGEEDEESESESEDVEGWLADESERGSGGGVLVLVPGGRGDDIVGVDALRWRRAGRSGAGVDVERGVFRPERVGSSGVRAGDEKSMLPRTESGGAGVLRADRGGKSAPLEVGSDAFGAGARIGTCGVTVSRGFGTRSASRMKRKSSPNS